MERIKAKPGLALGVGLLACLAPAQGDFSIGGTSPLDYSATTSALLNNHIGNLSIEGVARGGGGSKSRRRGTRTTVSPMRLAVLPASDLGGLRLAPSSPAALSYRPDPAVRAAAKETFATRMARMNPAMRPQIRKAVDSMDCFAEYAKITREDGYRRDNVADAIASTLIVTWIGSKGKVVPTDVAGQRVVRARVATGLLADPRFKSAAFRQRLGDEMQLTTVFLAHGLAGAVHYRKGAEYGAAMARMFQELTGSSPDSVRLTSQGFVRA